MALVVVCSRSMVLLLLIHYLLLLPMFVSFFVVFFSFFCIWSLFYNAVLSVLSSFAIISLSKISAGGFTLWRVAVLYHFPTVPLVGLW